MDILSKYYSFRNPDFIKIDVEGAEKFILEGLATTLKEYRPVLMIEVHGRISVEQSFRFLEKYSYTLLIVLNSEKFFSSEAELLAWFPDSVLQVGCFPK